MAEGCLERVRASSPRESVHQPSCGTWPVPGSARRTCARSSSPTATSTTSVGPPLWFVVPARRLRCTKRTRPWSPGASRRTRGTGRCVLCRACWVSVRSPRRGCFATVMSWAGFVCCMFRVTRAGASRSRARTAWCCRGTHCWATGTARWSPRPEARVGRRAGNGVGVVDPGGLHPGAAAWPRSPGLGAARGVGSGSCLTGCGRGSRRWATVVQAPA